MPSPLSSNRISKLSGLVRKYTGQRRFVLFYARGSTMRAVCTEEGAGGCVICLHFVRGKTPEAASAFAAYLHAELNALDSDVARELRREPGTRQLRDFVVDRAVEFHGVSAHRILL